MSNISPPHSFGKGLEEEKEEPLSAIRPENRNLLKQKTKSSEFFISFSENSLDDIVPSEETINIAPMSFLATKTFIAHDFSKSGAGKRMALRDLEEKKMKK